MYSALQLSFGAISSAAKIARNITTELQKAYSGYTIEITGASQGGAIAQYAAITKNIRAKAVVFNSLALSEDITSTLSNEQKSRIRHAYVQGETLNGSNYHLMGLALQNDMPVQGSIIPVSGELEDILSNNFYHSFSYWETPLYYATTYAGMMHWTGSLLKAVEYHAGYNELPSLYYPYQ